VASDVRFCTTVRSRPPQRAPSAVAVRVLVLRPVLFRRLMKQREGSECFAEGSFFARDSAPCTQTQTPSMANGARNWATSGAIGMAMPPPTPRRPASSSSPSIVGLSTIITVGRVLLSWYLVAAAPCPVASELRPTVLIRSLGDPSHGTQAWRSRLWPSCSSPVGPRSTRASSLARRILAMVERRVFGLGRVLSINKDRLAHAFIRTNNALVRLAPQGIAPQRVLILLPALFAQGAARPSAQPGQRSQRRGGDRCGGRAGRAQRTPGEATERRDWCPPANAIC